MSTKLKSIDEYLPKKEDTRLMAVRIPEYIYDAANEWREFDEITWKELSIALLKRYIEERARGG